MLKIKDFENNKDKLKNKVIYIGMLGLSIEDIIKYKHCFNEKDVFRF